MSDATARLDVERVRKDFPVLATKANGKDLVFLDSAASAQKPNAVIDAIAEHQRTGYANIHRGVYQLSQRSTEAFEDARAKTARFLSAADPREIVFTRNATEAINLVAQTWGRSQLQPGDEILITEMEHHANIVPWQMLCEATGAVLRVAPIDDEGVLRSDAFGELLSSRTRLVAFTHVSNALGTINPARELTAQAHAHGAVVLIDGAQAVPHMAVDVCEIGCDFYVFTGHKLFGPSGVGVLYGKLALLEAMPPYQGGGDMIETVTFEKTTYAPVPHKFEAGTPDISGVIGLGAAIDYVTALGLDAIANHERELLEYATKRLAAIPGLTIIGKATHKAAVVSFVLDFAHPHDIGTILDQEGIALRTGHHCAQPIMEHFKVPATARASFSIYNTFEDVDRLVEAIEGVRELFT
jgi:cysteine desulfurase/selenocysteine lyase